MEFHIWSELYDFDNYNCALMSHDMGDICFGCGSVCRYFVEFQ